MVRVNELPWTGTLGAFGCSTPRSRAPWQCSENLSCYQPAFKFFVHKQTTSYPQHAPLLIYHCPPNFEIFVGYFLKYLQAPHYYFNLKLTHSLVEKCMHGVLKNAFSFVQNPMILCSFLFSLLSHTCCNFKKSPNLIMRKSCFCFTFAKCAFFWTAWKRFKKFSCFIQACILHAIPICAISRVTEAHLWRHKLTLLCCPKSAMCNKCLMQPAGFHLRLQL